MRSVFTADLHLKISPSKKSYSSFVTFLDYLEKNYDRLYILGDLFTYWYEHPKVDFYSKNPVLRALKEKEIEVFFISGNRDFMAGKFFKKYSKVEFLGSELNLKFKQGKIFLTHGDKLAKKDIRYQIWRKFVQSPFSAFIFKRLPVGYAISVVDNFKKVGKSNPKKEKQIARMIVNGARKKFQKNRDIDIIISGHAHYKLEKSIKIENENKKLIILPEFKFPGEFLVMDQGRLNFKHLGGKFSYTSTTGT
ncbi:MAG: UDP-2,3-diacylglucosamine diphosphatase [Elusimicrobiota bacterium]